MLCIILADTIKAKPKKEKDIRPQSKSQPRISAKKTSNRRSPSKKDKNGLSAADVPPPEPAESPVVAPCSEEGGEEPQLGSSCSPAHQQFQRTLSPADVLHVHSYAKGDYGEGETAAKEEKKSESSDNEMEKDNILVSRWRHYTRYCCIVCLTAPSKLHSH